MEEIAISKFKGICLAVLERVRKTGEPIMVTRFGQPIARIEPPNQHAKRIRLGSMAGFTEILSGQSPTFPTGKSSGMESRKINPNAPSSRYEYMAMEHPGAA